MKATDIIMNKEIGSTLQSVLESGAWGTIGPHSVSGADMLRSGVGAGYGLVCHSETAAYEAVLRAFGCAYGDRVAVPSRCVPFTATLPVCAGAAPLFCTVDGSGILTADALERTLSAGCDGIIRAVCVDVTPSAMPELSALRSVCDKYALPLVLLAHGFISAKYNGEPLTRYADAAIYSLGDDSEIDCCGGGFVAADREAVFAGIFAYHNCGRSFGEGCSLDCDRLIGGDLRVSEWNACLIQHRLANPGTATVPETADMTREPLFRSEYFKKMTGYTGVQTA